MEIPPPAGATNSSIRNASNLLAIPETQSVQNSSSTSSSCMIHKTTHFTSSRTSTTLPKIASDENFVVRTSKAEKDKIDEQLAKFVFATHIAFNAIENAEFLRFCELMRPGYRPPCRKTLSTTLY